VEKLRWEETKKFEHNYSDFIDALKPSKDPWLGLVQWGSNGILREKALLSIRDLFFLFVSQESHNSSSAEILKPNLPLQRWLRFKGR
jgi:hypothetical protein